MGDAGLVETMRRHPFARALRVDKLTLAALEATLEGPVAPVPAALAVPGDMLLSRAQRICDQLPAHVGAEAVTSSATVGGGGAPEVSLPSAAVSLPTGLAESLRLGSPPVVGHLEHGRLLLDLLAVDPADDPVVVQAVRRCAAAAGD
jgi:L-seryl-tRNA(Ser) seleniumtransferase